MYGRILLAYDGTKEGRAALREGAMLAKQCGSEIFLLSVIPNSAGVQLAESASGGPIGKREESYQAIFEEGVTRLKQLGFHPKGRLVSGEPVGQIGAYAKQIKADLVVVGHRRRGLIERWWSGSTGGYLVDTIECSLLIGRNTISDDAFAAAFETSAAG